MKRKGFKFKQRDTAETRALQRFSDRRKAERKLKEKDIFFTLGIENISPVEKQENFKLSNVIAGSIKC